MPNLVNFDKKNSYYQAATKNFNNHGITNNNSFHSKVSSHEISDSNIIKSLAHITIKGFKHEMLHLPGNTARALSCWSQNILCEDRNYHNPLTACVITWLCTDSSLPDCYIVLLITSKHPTHSNTGTVTVAELSCTHSFPHNDPMHGFGDECVQYYSQPQSCTHV